MLKRETTMVLAGRLRFIGLVVAIAWAAFWSLFGLASGLGEGLWAEGVVAHAVVPGGVFLAAALIAWRWQAAGALLLVAAASAAAGYFPSAHTAEGFAMIALPGLVAGGLLLADLVARRW